MTAAAKQPFSVMVKPVGARCNMKCSYCYYRQGGDNPDQLPLDDARVSPHMSDRVLEQFIRQYCEAAQGPEVSFVWHGGEPTLAGIGFFQRALELQRRYLPDGWQCWNNLQTNGVLLDDEWCAFLAASNFDVGLSIDGTAELHDRYRRDLDGGGSYAAAAGAVARLQQHGIQPDLLCTVTSSAAGQALHAYRALRELGTGWIQFIPIVRRQSGSITGQATADSVSGTGYGDFLCAIFSEWLVNDLGRVNVQLFAELASMRAGGQAGLCWLAPTCGRALIVEQDGGVYCCDHYVSEQYRLGDIADSHLGELADSEIQQRFGLVKSAGLPGECRRCQWLSLCNGGCPKDRFAFSADGEPGMNHLCAGLKRFFGYAVPLIDELLSLTRQGYSSGYMMNALRQAAASRWNGVSRNDPCICGSGRKAKNCCWSLRM